MNDGKYYLREERPLHIKQFTYFTLFCLAAIIPALLSEQVILILLFALMSFFGATFLLIDLCSYIMNRYCYYDEFLWFWLICKRRAKKISYEQIKYIFISNALGLAIGGTIYGCPDLKKKKQEVDGTSTYVEQAYVTLHSADDFSRYLKPPYTYIGWRLIKLKSLITLFECNWKSVEELFQHVDCEVLILEDVYIWFHSI